MQKKFLQLPWVNLLLALGSGLVPIELSDLLHAPVSPPALLFQRRASFCFRLQVSPWPLERMKELMESEK